MPSGGHLGDLYATIGADYSQLDRAEARVKRFTGTVVGRFSKAVKAATSLQSVIAGMAVTYGLSRMAKSTLDVAASFERMEITLDKLTQGHGAETLERINKWAIRMPVDTRQAVDSFKTMMAYGLNPTIEKMELLVDVGSVFGQEVIPRIALALGQMSALGRVSAQDLNQLANAGLNARKYLREAFGGKSLEEIKKAGITMDEILNAIWQGIERDFGGAAKMAMKSWEGLKLTFVSYIVEIQRQVMAAGVFEALKNKMREVDDFLENWLKNNRELIRIKVPEYLNAVSAAFSALWTSIRVGIDAFRTLWGIVSAVPKGVLEFIKNYQSSLEQAIDKTDKFNEKSKDIETNWSKVVRFFTQWGNNIIAVFEFMLRASSEALATLLKTAYDAAVVIGQEFMSTGKIIWYALTFRFNKVSEEWGKLVEGPMTQYNKKLAVNWQALSLSIKASWEDAMRDMGLTAQEAAEKVTKATEEGRKATDDIAKKVSENLRKFHEIERTTDTGLLAYVERKHKALDDEKEKRKAILNLLFAQTDAALRLEQGNEAYYEQLADVMDESKKKAQDVGQSYEWVGYKAKETYDGMVELSQRTAEAMEQNFSDLFFNVMEGKFKSFGDYANAILHSVNRAVADVLGQQIKTSLFGKGPQVGGLIGKLTGGFSGAGTSFGFGAPSLASGAYDVLYSIMHKGGMVGVTPTPFVRASADLLENAPRLHNGLRPDEIPAILQKGETVLPKGENRGSVVINNYIQASDGQISRESLGQLEERTARALARAKRRNG